MLKRLPVIIALLCCAATVSFAQGKKIRRENADDKLITALIDAEEIRGIFGDDAMYTFTGTAEIEQIFALGEKAIPLLIAHLDDKRLLKVSTSTATFRKTEEFTVTVGAACFDLLSYIIRADARFFNRNCLNDLREQGEGHASSCANARYRIFPEDFWAGAKRIRGNLWRGKTLIVKESVRQAKLNWQRAYRKREIHYEKFDG